MLKQLVADLTLEQISPVVYGLVLVVVVLELEAQIAIDAFVHAWFPWGFVLLRLANVTVVVTSDVQPKCRLEVEHLGADDALQVGLI